MKIGFYTSTFNDRPLEEVVDFAASAGFDAIEIDVSGHIKTPDRVADAVTLARHRNLFVSSVTYFGNQLDADRDKRRELRGKTVEFARAIGETGVPIFVIFPGRDDSASDEANYDDFADFANGLIEETRSSGLTFAIENWPGTEKQFSSARRQRVGRSFSRESRIAASGWNSIPRTSSASASIPIGQCRR